MKKGYGSNGTTAEEPPIRTRLRRFKQDWELFRERSWPVLGYENLLRDPEQTLRQACSEMELPWDQGMLTWPKNPSQIADRKHANRTFLVTRRQTFAETADPKLAEVCVSAIPPGDLAWIEEVFADYNRIEGYPQHIPAKAQWSQPNEWAVPRYERTRRYKKRRPWFAFIVKPFRILSSARLR